jgi:hypothetical protein
MSESKTIDELVDSSPKVLAFLKQRNDNLTPESQQKYEIMMKEPSIYPRVMILAMDDKAYYLISYLLEEVKHSDYNDQLLGYALFQGHLNVVLVLEKRIDFNKANISWLTAQHLYGLGLISESNDIKGPLDIAILSGKTAVIDYVSNKVDIKSSSLIRAAEYGKLDFMKHIYSDTMRSEARVEALAISLRLATSDCVSFLLSRVPKEGYNLDLVMASLEYGDSKVFSKIFKETELKHDDISEILREIKEGNYEKELAIVSEDSRVTQEMLKTTFNTKVSDMVVTNETSLL